MFEIIDVETNVKWEGGKKMRKIGRSTEKMPINKDMLNLIISESVQLHFFELLISILKISLDRKKQSCEPRK